MVDFIHQIDLNIFSLIMLSVMLQTINEQRYSESKSKQAFNRLLIAVICMLSLDIITWIVNGREGELYRVLNYVSNSLLLGLTLLPPILWILYLGRLTVKGFNPDKRIYFVLLTPWLIILFMSAVSPFTGWIYTINAENIYSRGPFFNLMNILSFSYCAVGAVIIFRGNKHFSRAKRLSLLSFIFFPLIGGFLQVIYYGLILYWNSLAFSMIIIYLQVQSKEVNLDYLTDVNSRRSFDNQLSKRIDSFTPQNKFAVIMIDIDKFKEINDKYGHKSGDRALVNFAASLKKAVRSSDFIARYGGDEFVIIIDCDNKMVVDRVIYRIKRELENFNKTGRESYQLDFSFGYAIYDEKLNLDSDHFVDYVDKLMYNYKKNKET